MAESGIFQIMYPDGRIKTFIGDIRRDAIETVEAEAIRVSEIILSHIGNGPISYKEDAPEEQLKEEGTFIMNFNDHTTKPLGRTTPKEAIAAARREAVRISELKLYVPVDWKAELAFMP